MTHKELMLLAEGLDDGQRLVGVTAGDVRALVDEFLDAAEHVHHPECMACGITGTAEEIREHVKTCAEHPLAAAERALSEARGLAEEVIAYVPDYFREKWDFDARLAALRAPVPPGETSPVPSPIRCQVVPGEGGPKCGGEVVAGRCTVCRSFVATSTDRAAPAAHPETTPKEEP